MITPCELQSVAFTDFIHVKIKLYSILNNTYIFNSRIKQDNHMLLR